MDATNSTQTGSVMPFRLAAAYGVPRPASVARPATAQPMESAAPAPIPGRSAEGIARLVAARVPQTMDFDVPKSMQRSESGSLTMYRHPADRNAAATGVELGRRIDMQG